MAMLAGLLALYITSTAQNKNFIDQPYIDVSATADTMIVPDEIFINIYISERDTRDRVSLEEQEKKMITGFQQLGIDIGKDLTTYGFLSNYRNKIFREKDVIISRSYLLKVSTATLASAAFLELEDLGISNAGINRVDLSRRDGIKNELRMKAIYTAKQKANDMVMPLGQQVGQALYVGEIPPNYNAAIQNSNQLQDVVVTGFGLQETKSKGIDSNINFDRMEVTSTVNIKFALK